MKRFVTTIFAIAVFAGVLAPVSASLTAQAGVSFHPQVAMAQSAPTQLSDSSNNSSVLSAFLDKNLQCGAVFGSFSHCIAWIFYYIPYTIGGKLLWFSAWMFDEMAAVTLSSTYYSGVSFISDSWKIIRDFSNIFFILILLFIALSLVLDMDIGHANPKSMLASVVLIAVLINFSFFITEVVIDLSNSLALVFYNQITVVDTSANGATITETGYTKQISVALAQGFSPQILQSKEFWNGLGKPADRSTNGGIFSALWASIKNPNNPAAGVAAYYGTDINAPDIDLNTQAIVSLMVVFILVGVMYSIVAYSFFVAMLSFIGRLITLWLTIIFAPIAFVSYIIPSTRHLESFGWENWWKNLISTAFAAPIYFFFLLLISLMMRSQLVTKQFVTNHGSWATLLVVIISMIFFCYLILMATKYVKKGAGEIGAMVVKAGTGVAALAGGLALGGLAGAGSYALRNTVGKVGKGLAEDSERKALASGDVTDAYKQSHAWTTGMTDDQIKMDSRFRATRWRAEKELKLGRGIAGSSFDLRQNAIANLVSEKSGMNFGSFGKLAAASSAGGYEGASARQAKKKQDFANSLGASHSKQVALDNTVAAREAEVKALDLEIAVARRRDQNDPNNRNHVIALEEQKRTLVGGVPRYSAAEIQSAIDNGIINPATGQAFTRDNIGDVKEQYRGGNHTYTQADVQNGTLRADGERVTASDIGKLRTDSASLDELKKAQENNQKARANSFLHYTMLNSGYNVEGARTDILGNTRILGHLHGVGGSNRDQMRSLGRSIRSAFGSAAMGAAIGTAVAGPLGTVLGGLTGLVGQVRREMQIANGAITDVVKGQAAYAAEMAADSHHQIHEHQSKYKSPSAGIFEMFKDIFKSSGGGGGGHGGGHGGGGHGGGHGGH